MGLRPGFGAGDWTPGAPLSITEIRHVHAVALTQAWNVAPHPNATPEEAPGSFRRHDIHPFPSGMIPPSWVEVPAALADWVNSLTGLDALDNPVEAIAAAHAGFERIHPFLDGNGRCGRLLMNLLLVRLGYPPAVVYTRDRNRYLRALQRADNGDPGPLGELIARSVTDNLYHFVVPAVAGPHRLVPIASLAKERRAFPRFVPPSRGAASGHEKARTVNGKARVWVDEYVASKYKRRS